LLFFACSGALLRFRRGFQPESVLSKENLSWFAKKLSAGQEKSCPSGVPDRKNPARAAFQIGKVMPGKEIQPEAQKRFLEREKAEM